MEIQKIVNPDDYQVGVVVARYQVNKLHDQQRKMLDLVLSNHKKVIIFLGVSRTVPTRRNTLDFATRKAMVQKHYPTAIILPLQDIRSDEAWSKQLDSKIREVFSGLKPLLYGSRDSFIPYYKGKNATTELTSTAEISGTEIREKVSREILESSKFRAGVIHAVYAFPPKVYPTVDVCAYNDDGQILLARKPNEDKFRFIGGFVDATDTNLEHSARREFMEEANGCHIGDLRYILSQQVDDWRYSKEQDGIMTTLFLGKFGFGQVKPSDDLVGGDLQWIDFSVLTDPEYIKHNIMVEHQTMMARLVMKVYTEKLIPNLGKFHKQVPVKIDPDAVQPNEFLINL